MLITADDYHANYRAQVTQLEFIALTERPSLRMSRFQRAALWLCYAEQKRSRQTAPEIIRAALGLSRCGDDQCPCRSGDACPKEDCN